MNCAESRDWLDALIDGELDLTTSVQIERHLLDCPACASARDAMLALREQFRSSSFRSTASVTLKRRVIATVSRERSPVRAWRVAVPLAPYAAIAATLLLTVWILVPQITRSPNVVALGELVAAHVRSTQVDHLIDVLSTDQHTVKPWFEGKLDFSPPVRDFTPSGFELIGGRLDYMTNGSVAAIVYRRNKHVINVFIRREHGEDQPMRIDSSQGFNVVEWRKGELAFSAISDLNSAELTELARLIAAGP